MSEHETIKAWKDRRYRSRLTDTQRGALGAHPAGVPEVPDDFLEGVAAGASFWCWLSIGCTQNQVGCGASGSGGSAW